MTDLIDDLRRLADNLAKHTQLSEDSGTMYGAGEANICRVTRTGLLRIIDKHSGARAEIEREALRLAAKDLLATGQHSGACAGTPYEDGTPLPDSAPKPGECMCALGQHYRWLISRSTLTPHPEEETRP